MLSRSTAVDRVRSLTLGISSRLGCRPSAELWTGGTTIRDGITKCCFTPVRSLLVSLKNGLMRL